MGEVKQAKKVAQVNKPQAGQEMSLDAYIDKMVANSLVPFHATLSSRNMTIRNPKLDLAIDKISQAITALNAWSREVKEKK